MARADKGRVLKSEVYESTMSKMRSRGESVGDRGATNYRSTRETHKMVDVSKGQIKKCKNALTIDSDGKLYLTGGVSLPIIQLFDGTASMGKNVQIAFEQIGQVLHMVEFLKGRYLPNFAAGVVQDVDDNMPVLTVTQFETDERYLEWMKHLLIDNSGGDAIEDYDLAELFLLMQTDVDIAKMYGLKGYSFLTADMYGRGQVDSRTAMRHLGIQIENMDTEEIAKQASKSWWQFFLQVNDNSSTTSWWKKVYGQQNVVMLPRTELLSVTQVAIMYALENLHVGRSELTDFMIDSTSGSNMPISQRDAESVYNALDRANIPFGGQAMLPGFNNIPLPGSGPFANNGDAYPVDWDGSTHTPTSPPVDFKTDDDGIDWSPL